uniref:Phosphatidylinositol transfer protein N-terminal domain-containing protein n=1 Tax=Sus scrofa TaxID=9823 RepID=A0A8D0SGI9_PIG
MQCVPGDISLGQTGRRRGSPGSDLVSEADRAGDFCAFVLIFGNLSFFPSLARRRACPDLAPAPTDPGYRIERFPAGLPPSPPDFATPRSRRIDLGKEGDGGAVNTRTRTLTCSRAVRRKPGSERTAGAASPAGSERGAPGALPCAWAAALLVWGRPPLPALGVRGRQDHAAEGVQDLHAAHRGRANCLAGLELLFPKYFMLQRRHGTIIPTRLQIFDNEAKDLEREVCFIDIACDEIPERYYKESEDPKHFKSEKTGRGQLREGWRDSHQPIMCSYKLVTVKFEVWGLQTRVEQFVHKVVRDILLIGHRQAFAWVDEWYDMTMDDVREYEKNMHEQTNIKVCNQHSSTVDHIESQTQTST